MIQESVVNGFKVYTLSAVDNNTKMSCIPQRGGMLSSLLMPGHSGLRELLFQHENFWTAPKTELVGAWPFCFPICGRLQRLDQVGCYYYDGHVYQLPMHGFAWQETWQVQDMGADYIILSLAATARTLTSYPFHFNVELHYQLSAKQLLCKQKYQNLGDRAMPYYAGFHPYFLTPPPQQGKEKVFLNFSTRRRLQYNQSLTDIIGLQPPLNLPTAITNPQINEQLSELGDNKTVSLSYPDGDILNMTVVGVDDVDLFPLLQLYTQADKPFICIEPWMSYPNALNSVCGVRWLAPRQIEQAILTLTLNS